MNARAVQDINDRQNDVEHIRLLQAADVEHAKAQRVESARWGGVALILSVAGLAAVLFPDLRVAAAIIGVVFAVLTEIVWPLVTKNSNNRAVLIQEQFDTSLFQIPWNPDLGRPVPLVDVADAAARYGKGDKRNWYLDVRGIPSPIAETLCQRENLIWDADQREAWAWRLVAGLSAWLAVGLTVSLAAQWYVWQLLAWYIAPPTLPAAALALRSLVQQRSVARTKIELRERIDDALQGLTPPHRLAGETQRTGRGAANSTRQDLQVPSRLRPCSRTFLQSTSQPVRKQSSSRGRALQGHLGR